MGLIHCPECGTKVSIKARFCIHCGYSDDNKKLIESDQSYQVKSFNYYDVTNESNMYYEMPYTILDSQDNNKIMSYFNTFERVQKYMPDVVSLFEVMAKDEKKLVLDLPKYVMEKITNGELRLMHDKLGRILPTLRDKNGFAMNVRMKEVKIPMEFSNIIESISEKAAMDRLLLEVEQVNISIGEIKQELHDDRIAEAEASLDMMYQTQFIEDSRVREMMITNIIVSSTTSKRKLMRNFTSNIQYLKLEENKSNQLFNKTKTFNEKATDALVALKTVTNLVQLEVKGYNLLKEVNSSKVALGQFYKFIKDNDLDNKDTLLLINESLNEKQIAAINRFSELVIGIEGYMNQNPIENNTVFNIEEDKIDA